MQLDTRSKLSGNTIFLHWVVALMMIALLGTGVYMEHNELYALYPWHKSFGVLIFVFALWRVLWRMKNGWFAHVGDYSAMEKSLSKIVHYLLLIGTILMPVSGFLMSSLGGHGVALFGLELVARNPDPENMRQVIALNEPLAHFAHTMHGLGGKLIIAGVVLHVVGALKHHFVDKDGTIRRMLGARL